LAKYNSNGSLLWVKQLGGSRPDGIQAVVEDPTGLIDVVGVFRSSDADFMGTNLSSSGGTDFFLARLTTEGSLVWLKQGGSPGDQVPYGLAVDPAGNCFISGFFSGSSNANFEGTILTNRAAVQFGSPLRSDRFLAKYNASGVFEWAHTFSSPNDGWRSPVAADSEGNVFVSGFLSGSATFGGTNLQSTAATNILLAKYSGAGDLLWARQFGGQGVGTVPESQGTDIKVDATGNIFLTGFFGSGVAWFDSIALTNAGSRDAFLIKTTPSGSVIWAESASGVMNVYHPPSITLDQENNVFQSCVFDSASFQAGSITFTNSSTNSTGWPSDSSVLKYSGTGSLLWARNLSGTGEDDVDALAADAAGNLYVTGGFNSSALQLDGIILHTAQSFSLLVAKVDTTLSPVLKCTQTPDALRLSWNSLFLGFQLESSDIPSGADTWIPYPTVPTEANLTNTVQVPLLKTHQYFRLAKP
ncbi:MAG: hypothetical protein JWM16_1372, partial [Verrucomicrobiales bacterium]|nr:hypothetical protein [Verrucomicrobiales bacterium]